MSDTKPDRDGDHSGGTHSSGAAGASAVGLNDRALGQKAGADGSGLLAVDSSVNTVAGEGDGASQLGGVGLGVREGTGADDVNLPSGAEVVELGSIELDLDGLAGADDLESFLGQAGGGHQETDTIELNLVTWVEDISTRLRSGWARHNYQKRKPRPSRQGQCQE